MDLVRREVGLRGARGKLLDLRMHGGRGLFEVGDRQPRGLDVLVDEVRREVVVLLASAGCLREDGGNREELGMSTAGVLALPATLLAVPADRFVVVDRGASELVALELPPEVYMQSRAAPGSRRPRHERR